MSVISKVPLTFEIVGGTAEEDECFRETFHRKIFATTNNFDPIQFSKRLGISAYPLEFN